jgi:hypothetical protein
MKKAIFVHISATILYLLCFMYVTNGIDLSPLVKGLNIIIIVIVNLFASIICVQQDLYKKQ